MSVENLTLLILGDNKVGKSTLINCYLTRAFSCVPSGVLKSKIEIPGTEYGCKYVNIHLCDSHKWNENLEKSILSSSAILIVGSWDNPQSINRIENHWIPSVSKLCETQSIPIIIIINKSDMLGGLDNVEYMNQEYRSSLCTQLQHHHMVKHVFQTSCIEIKSVITAFDIAIQLIIYPIQSLIISDNDYIFKSIQRHSSYQYYAAISKVKRKLQTKQRTNNRNPIQIITETFLIALTRIFHLLDRDNNALLTDNEILYYYRYCFTLNSMKLHQLQRLKKWLLSVSETEQKETESESTKHRAIHICYIKNDCVTFAGFVQLHLILVQMLQHDMVWKSLEKFGYKRKDLNIGTYPTVPNKTESMNYCCIHNALLRGNMSDTKCRIQYELSPNISGFLMSIFVDFCENRHDEYDNEYIHEYSTCFMSRYGVGKLLQKYNMNTFPFDVDDLKLVGVNVNCINRKKYCITLSAWLSLWSLLMCYDTERALEYLVIMGAPSIFPSHDFIPKWTDYLVPQMAWCANTHQRLYKTLIVTYPYNKALIEAFIRLSVDTVTETDTETDTETVIETYDRQNIHRTKRKISAVSRTGSLSPIVEATKEHWFGLNHEYQEYMYHEDDNKYQEQEDGKDEETDGESIQRLNTVFLMKPRDTKCNYRSYSYGMLNDAQKADYIYNEYHTFLFKKTQNKRKPLIEVNLLNKSLGVDAYHILHESWPEYASNEQSSGQNELFDVETKGNIHNGFEKHVEKHLKAYDAVVYLHTTDALSYTRNIKRLYGICRDVKMPIITVDIPFDVEQVSRDNDNDNDNDMMYLNQDSLSIITGQSKTAQIGTDKQMKYEQSIQELMQILQIYDLPHRLLRWESFPEDQLRFSHDLIERLHFRERYLPKTIWEKRKINAIRYTKKATIYALGIGLMCYLTPMNSVSKYLKLPTINIKNKRKSVKGKKEGKERKKRKDNKRNERWKALIAIAVVTSVFCGGYFIYDVYGKYMYRYNVDRNVKHQNKDKEEEEDDEEEEEDDNNGSILSYLMSFFYPNLYDEQDDDYNDDLSLTSFRFLKRNDD